MKTCKFLPRTSFTTFSSRLPSWHPFVGFPLVAKIAMPSPVEGRVSFMLSSRPEEARLAEQKVTFGT
jgi:hypothetical protein